MCMDPPWSDGVAARRGGQRAHLHSCVDGVRSGTLCTGVERFVRVATLQLGVWLVLVRYDCDVVCFVFCVLCCVV